MNSLDEQLEREAQKNTITDTELDTPMKALAANLAGTIVASVATMGRLMGASDAIVTRTQASIAATLRDYMVQDVAVLAEEPETRTTAASSTAEKQAEAAGMLQGTRFLVGQIADYLHLPADKTAAVNTSILDAFNTAFLDLQVAQDAQQE
jgi:hypothetical protein